MLLNLFTLAWLASRVAAVTLITDDEMNSLLDAGAVDLADRYAPMWFFGQAMDQPPCYPTWAFGGSPSTPDIYDNAHMTPPAAQCEYPDVGCNCRNPGVAIGNPGPAFPVYYTFQRCNDTEVRVVYNLFYEKDGAIVAGLVQTGHNYDWERVIVIHSRDDSNMWAPSRALLSAHSGYNDLAWGDIQNTLTTDEVNAGDAKTPNGVQNEDAFRSDDWWHFVETQNYVCDAHVPGLGSRLTIWQIRSDNSTDAGRALGAADWGSATSNPPLVQSTVCNAP
ncbi:hypothetical protein N7526_006279 [Penicillium atrosanguineum]|nr:hypothetical protein N7526_006279 [Penicillium atrosanguineum]